MNHWIWGVAGGSLFLDKAMSRDMAILSPSIVDMTIYIYIYLGCDFRHVLIISVRFGMRSAMN